MLRLPWPAYRACRASSVDVGNPAGAFLLVESGGLQRPTKLSALPIEASLMSTEQPERRRPHLPVYSISNRDEREKAWRRLACGSASDEEALAIVRAIREWDHIVAPLRLPPANDNMPPAPARKPNSSLLQQASDLLVSLFVGPKG
jgi:hypothetical protein